MTGWHCIATVMQAMLFLDIGVHVRESTDLELMHLPLPPVKFCTWARMCQTDP